MTEEDAAALAIARLSVLFLPSRIPELIRRKAELFGGRTALEWIKEGRIEEVVQRYEDLFHW